MSSIPQRSETNPRSIHETHCDEQRGALNHRDERGFALILTVFIVALATILVLDFSDETLLYQRTSRSYTERVQADYMLKSAVNLGRVLLALPKQDGIREDWLGEPWALIAAAPSLPISGFIGEPRITIVDDSGKLNLNAITSGANSQGINIPPAGQNQQGGTGNDFGTYWKNVIRELFVQAGLNQQDYEKGDFRTLGDRSYAPRDQVAVLHDWMDADSRSHSSAAFPGEGIESSSDNAWFFNRHVRSLSELAMIPGITLERLSLIAPYVRVGAPNDFRVNVNTAPLQVLTALGFQESEAIEMVQQRTNLPITQQILTTLVEGGSPQLRTATTTTSRIFSIYARVRMPNVTRWAKARVRVSGSRNRRRSRIIGVEFL